MIKQPLISVIITSYTAEHIQDIYELLDSLKNQTYQYVEVVFVAEQSLELYKQIQSYMNSQSKSKFKLIFNDGEKGASAARNLGIKQAQGEIIAFLDDDVLPFPDWAEEMIKTYDDLPIIGVTGPAVPPVGRW